MLLAEQPQPGTIPDLGVSCEDDLWQRYRRCPQDGSALSQLMEYYLPLATRIVNRLSFRFGHRFEAADLLGAAILGLHSAIQRFSDERGLPFGAYARKRIAGAVLDDLRQRDPLTRRQRSRLRAAHQAMQAFAQCNDRPPTDEELAAELGVSPEEVARTLALGYHTVSLQEATADGLAYEDLIVDESTLTPMESADLETARRALREAIPKLNVRDQQLLFFRHSQALSVNEIAAVFEVTPGRISQMYNSTIVRLRALMKVECTA